MSFALSFAAPYYTGASRSVEVPQRFNCSLAGRGYMIDTAMIDQFQRRAIPLLRNQADDADAPGEQTLSPEELWRRSQDSYDHGAGQTYLDREDSDNRRFRSSKGVDVWTKWQLGLLPATASRRASANTNLAVVPVGDNLYLTDGTALVRTTDLSTFTAVTGLPNSPTSIASDGFTVWTAHGASGIYTTTRGGASSASYNTINATTLGYVKGRLMVAHNATLYNVTSTTAPTALYTHPNTDFRWVGFAEGQAAIYAAGFSGDKSLIYRTSIKQDGTALDIPIVAGELPDGEIVRSVAGYLGFVLLGTDKGVRFCATDDSGNLTVGSLIRTTAPVRCFEGQDKYVWFGWENYDATSTGLGRMDLSTFIAALTPAYASDLMVTGQGSVTSVATFRDRRVLAVSGLGFFEESTSKVSSGTLDTGLITYGLPDPKTAVYLDVRLQAAVDTNRAYISTDGGAFVKVGERATTVMEPFSVGELSGETFEIRHELVNSDATATVGPVITRYTLRSFPHPAQGEVFTVPLLLHERISTVTDDVYLLDPELEFSALATLRESKQLVTFQLGTESHTVQVDDAMFQYSHLTEDRTGWNGTAMVKLKSPAN